MPKSTINPFNWLHQPYPPEMEGASVVFLTESSPTTVKIQAVLTYIGSSVFHCTFGAQRQYDLNGWHRVGSYIRAIVECASQGGMFSISHGSVPKQTGKLTLLDTQSPASGLPRTWPQVWANAAFDPKLTQTGANMANGPTRNEDSELLNMLTGGQPTAGATPATEPPEPTPRVPEGDPSDNAIPPHRRSVIKGLRKPEDYLASLVR